MEDVKCECCGKTIPANVYIDDVTAEILERSKKSNAIKELGVPFCLVIVKSNGVSNYIHPMRPPRELMKATFKLILTHVISGKNIETEAYDDK